MIRVLLVEDSAVTREYLAQLLDADPMLSVVGQARDGAEAIELAEGLRPDVIVMDVQMPRVDGYVATRQIMERVPTPIVMATAHSAEFEAKAFEALRAGALVLVDKPEGPGHPNAAAAALRLASTVKLMAEVKVVRRWSSEGVGRLPVERAVVRSTSPIRAVAIGASAGGPPTVAEILGALPRDLRSPVLLVQHIAPGFVGGLVDWLARATPLRVKLAEAGERVRDATVYVAPDGVQMGLNRSGEIALTCDAAVDGFRPSASYLLRSVADSYRSSALGVLLTGMGRDGAAGLLELRERGGITIAQDRESSVVFGMPGEAIRIGAAEHVLPPARIAGTIRALVTGAGTTMGAPT